MLKYLYVCVSSKKDLFLEQTFVSIISLKQKNPNAFVSILMDLCTKESLIDGREKIEKIADEIVVCDLPRELSSKVRSRILKTSMRNLLKGDFLYIDSDTLIMDNLSSIDKMPYDFAGVRDSHVLLSENVQNFTHERLKKMVCQEKEFLLDEIFINGGVLFVRDTKDNRKFFKKWNELYFYHFEKNNISQDQPSLALLNFENKHIIQELDGGWNCQFRYGANFFHKVKILHFLTSSGTPKLINDLYHNLRENHFSEMAIENIKNNFENRAFDFGKSILVCNDEYEIMKTAMYRMLFVLYKKCPKLFKIFEIFASFGRGRGLYFKINKDV